jgi:hypothetical protein
MELVNNSFFSSGILLFNLAIACTLIGGGTGLGILKTSS